MQPEDILYHITIATLPGELIQTRRGQMTYEQWVREEKARIEKKSGWPVAIYRHPGGEEISLVHLKVPFHP